MAAAALDHARHERARELDRRAQVDVEGAVDLLGGEVDDRPAGRERRVGDEHVDRAGALGQLRRSRARRPGRP